VAECGTMYRFDAAPRFHMSDNILDHPRRNPVRIASPPDAYSLHSLDHAVAAVVQVIPVGRTSKENPERSCGGGGK
jgi:predicted deacetylase